MVEEKCVAEISRQLDGRTCSLSGKWTRGNFQEEA
jgi:hypothetical protein